MSESQIFLAGIERIHNDIEASFRRQDASVDRRPVITLERDSVDNCSIERFGRPFFIYGKRHVE